MDTELPHICSVCRKDSDAFPMVIAVDKLHKNGNDSYPRRCYKLFVCEHCSLSLDEPAIVHALTEEIHRKEAANDRGTKPTGAGEGVC